MCSSKLSLKITTPFDTRHRESSQNAHTFVMSDVLRPGKYYHPTSKQTILLVEIKEQLVVR